MQQEIKYVGFYQNPLGSSKRNYALPATNKMDYIISAINEAGFKVVIVTPSWMTEENEQPFYEATKINKLSKWKRVISVNSWKTSNRPFLYVKIIWSWLWLMFWLICNVKKDEKILVYHSTWLSLPIILAKKINKFHLILEVEEIYSDVFTLNRFFDILERKIIKEADSFLFSTELLIDKIAEGRPFKVINGNYQIFDILNTPANDGRIHLVYAGIIDSHKAGAFNAVESALSLPENYVMHIIGFGEVEDLKLRINEINKISKCEVTYDGLKSGLDFVKFCQSCHIGLSTQKMDGDYLNTSFPSKILTYLGLGLQVVSCEVDCVKHSKIGSYVTFYEIDSPQAIAEAIKKIDVKALNNPRKKIKELHTEFVLKLKKMLTV